MTRFLFLIVFVCCAAALWSQTSGLLVSDDRYQQVPLLPTYSGVKYTEIPARVSLKKYCPVPGNQGKSGACVGWSVGYGALTIHRAILNNITDQALITKNAHSAAFLYNQIRKNKTDCSEGAYIEDGLVLLKTMGDCLEESFVFDKNDCAEQPNTQQIAEANQYRVQDFAAVYAIDEEAKSKISKTCKILATQTPIIVGIGITKSFFEVLPGADTWNPETTEATAGYHAMVVVGYNSVEKYFDLLNSFGASWGKNGFIRMYFDDFERLCRYAYVVVPPTNVATNKPTMVSNPPDTPTPTESVVLSGEFVFRQPAGYVSNENGDELMYFEEIATDLQKTGAVGLYQTTKAKFKVGDVFQLVAREIPRGRYVYVFSQSQDGTLNQHFPRKKQAIASAGFVLEKTVEIVIPSEESLLQLPVPGKDYLCIIYSHAPIGQYEQRLQSIEQEHGGVFEEKVYTAFADVLIEPQNIQFSDKKMAFSAITHPEKGKIATIMMLVVEAE